MKKKSGKVKLIVAFAAAVLISAVLIVLFLSDLCVIKTVNTEEAFGCTVREELFLREKFKGKNGLFAMGLFGRELDNTEKQLKFENPYIKKIDIEYKFPNKIVVSSVAREKSFAVEYSGDYLCLDSEGVLLEIMPEESMGTIPVVTGLKVVNCKAGSSVFDGKDKKADNAIRLCSILKANNFYETGVDIIDMEDEDCIWLFFAPDLSVKFGKAEDLNEKTVKLRSILTNGYDENSKGTIDFSLGPDPVFTENKKIEEDNPEEEEILVEEENNQ